MAKKVREKSSANKAPSGWEGPIGLGRFAAALADSDPAIEAWLSYCRACGQPTASAEEVAAAARLVREVVKSVFPPYYESSATERRRCTLALHVLWEGSDRVAAQVQEAIADVPETEDARKAEYVAGIAYYARALSKGLFLGAAAAIAAMSARLDPAFARLDPAWFEEQLRRVNERPGRNRVSAKRVAIEIACHVGAFGWGEGHAYEAIDRELGEAARRRRRRATGPLH